MCKIYYLCLSVVMMFSLSLTALAANVSLEPYEAAEGTDLEITEGQTESEYTVEKTTAKYYADFTGTASERVFPIEAITGNNGIAGKLVSEDVATVHNSTMGGKVSVNEDVVGETISEEDVAAERTVSGGDVTPTMPPAENNNSTGSSGSDSPSSGGTGSGSPGFDSIGSDSPAAAVTDLLRIDSTTLYPGMENTYAQGYIPQIENGKACIVLPLVGDTYDQKVTMSVDLGSTIESPFVFGNYSQTASLWDQVYLFRFEIPLAAHRINGTYPVTLTAAYLNAAGNQAQQSFTIYVTIADGKDPTQNANTETEREAVEKPKLFISTCEIRPGIVSGEEEFTVTLTIENIGAIRARSVILSYGSDAVGIVPKQTNNYLHLANIAAGHSEAASFELKTTKEVLAGNQSFYVKLDYEDLYGGIYTETRTFLVSVTQPSEMEFDSINIPKQLTSGETISVPINVYNTGKSTLQNVFVTVSVPGLYPVTSSFFGDVLPGQSGSGEMKIHVGNLSLTGAFGEDYGRTSGVFTITYYDEEGEEHKAEADVSTEIIPPAAEDTNVQEEEKTIGQWWVSVLVAFAIIAIMVASMVVTRFTRLIVLQAREIKA